jgi:hypothetical protein
MRVACPQGGNITPLYHYKTSSQVKPRCLIYTFEYADQSVNPNINLPPALLSCLTTDGQFPASFHVLLLKNPIFIIYYRYRTPMNMNPAVLSEPKVIDSFNSERLIILRNQLTRFLLNPYSCIHVPKLV